MASHSVYRLVRLAQKFLPPAIALVVVAFELALSPFDHTSALFWLRLGFYGLVGPLVTYAVLEWIAQEVLEKDRAERALEEANRRLLASGRIFREALESENLEEALQRIARALEETLGYPVALEAEGVRSGEGCGGVRVDLPGLKGYLEACPPAPERAFLEVLAHEVAGALQSVVARSRDLLTLFEVNQALKAEANLDRLLEGLLEKIRSWAEAEGGGVLLLDEEGFLVPRVAQGFSLPGHPFLPEGPWKGALEGPVFVEEGVLALPLKAREPVGVLVLKGKGLSRRIPFLSFLASQVALAVRNAQAYLKAEELAINEERTRIAREIHDGLAQSLAFMALKLDLVERLLSKDREAALRALAEVRETLRAQIREVRRSIFALRPIDLERYGFLESLRRYAQAFAEQAGFRVALSLPEAVGLSQASELVLFRVLQEALTNAAKHARPTRVEVVLEPLGERGARLLVRDNGRGFSAPEAQGLGGFGLTQMRERVEARGGRFWVASEPGRGTEVGAELPY
ncbi:sensor histidine kinase [Thermus composti]|uniref:Oxygen sensor histidine kinase NreB n=1 Tax=Thermus composti TaxID=532059 RepID=A0ABV6PZN2_9DEIN|nr:sensor histidine kinase [Thermus composti]GGM91515.1 sensor histidine kinase [Thermus composti]